MEFQEKTKYESGILRIIQYEAVRHLNQTTTLLLDHLYSALLLLIDFDEDDRFTVPKNPSL